MEGFPFSFIFLRFVAFPALFKIWLANFKLQEQEQALIDAISRLNEISDGESGTFHLFI